MIKKIPLFIISCFLLVGCSDDLNHDIDELFFSDEETVVMSNNEFAFKSLRVLSSFSQSNTVFSPFSMAVNLTGLMNASIGDTREQINDILNFGLLSIDQVNNSLNRLIETYNFADFQKFYLLNSVWMTDAVEIDSSYQNMSEYFFNISFHDITIPTNVDHNPIDKWIVENSHGLVTGLDTLLEITDVAILDIGYFKSKWLYDFTILDNAVFYSNDQEYNIQMLSSNQNLGYLRSEKYTSIEIPYGNEKYSFVGVLPNSGFSIDDVLDSFNSNRWKELLGDMELKDVHIELPYMELESNIDIKDLIRGMGFSDFGNNTSDIIKYSGDEWSLDAFFGRFEFNTEISGYGPCNEDIDVSVDVQMNKPFLFFLVQKSTNCIIFAGRFANPNSKDYEPKR